VGRGRLGKNVKPDPDGLPPHDVKDLHYGDVLFYFYQDDYFDSITRLLAAQQLDRLPNTEGEAELLLGGLYLSLGEHVEAGKIFEALLNSNTSAKRCATRPGSIWARSGISAAICEESERACAGVGQDQPRISAERYMLLAQLMLREQRYDDAIAALERLARPARLDRLCAVQPGRGAGAQGPTARRHLRISTGRAAWRPAARNCCPCEDKANLALGFALLQAQRPADAKPILERVRLEGPYSSKALLGVGWADSAWASSSARWCRGWRCASAICSTRRCRSRILTVPYAYNQLGATGQAAEFYNSAIDSFDAESSASTIPSSRSAAATCSTGC
jgi:tetratricopeptide (TPR) repeat protein